MPSLRFCHQHPHKYDKSIDNYLQTFFWITRTFEPTNTRKISIMLALTFCSSTLLKEFFKIKLLCKRKIIKCIIHTNIQGTYHLYVLNSSKSCGKLLITFSFLKSNGVSDTYLFQHIIFNIIVIDLFGCYLVKNIL